MGDLSMSAERGRILRQRQLLCRQRESLVWLIVPFALSLHDVFTLWQVWPLSDSTEDQIWRYLLFHGHRFLSKEGKPYFPSRLYDQQVRAINAQAAGEETWVPDEDKWGRVLHALFSLEPALIAAAEDFRGAEPRRYTNILEEWQGFHSTDDWADAGYMRQDFLNAGGAEGRAETKQWQQWHTFAKSLVETVWLDQVRQSLQILQTFQTQQQHVVQGPSARVQRRQLLLQLFEARGLELRSDSSICQAFIERGAGDLSHIVHVIEETQFLHQKTDYLLYKRRLLDDAANDPLEWHKHADIVMHATPTFPPTTATPPPVLPFPEEGRSTETAMHHVLSNQFYHSYHQNPKSRAKEMAKYMAIDAWVRSGRPSAALPLYLRMMYRATTMVHHEQWEAILDEFAADEAHLEMALPLVLTSRERGQLHDVAERRQLCHQSVYNKREKKKQIYLWKKQTPTPRAVVEFGASLPPKNGAAPPTPLRTDSVAKYPLSPLSAHRRASNESIQTPLSANEVPPAASSLSAGLASLLTPPNPLAQPTPASPSGEGELYPGHTKRRPSQSNLEEQDDRQVMTVPIQAVHDKGDIFAILDQFDADVSLTTLILPSKCMLKDAELDAYYRRLDLHVQNEQVKGSKKVNVVVRKRMKSEKAYESRKSSPATLSAGEAPTEVTTAAASYTEEAASRLYMEQHLPLPSSAAITIQPRRTTITFDTMATSAPTSHLSRSIPEPVIGEDAAHVPQRRRYQLSGRRSSLPEIAFLEPIVDAIPSLNEQLASLKSPEGPNEVKLPNILSRKQKRQVRDAVQEGYEMKVVDASTPGADAGLFLVKSPHQATKPEAEAADVLHDTSFLPDKEEDSPPFDPVMPPSPTHRGYSLGGEDPGSNAKNMHRKKSREVSQRLNELLNLLHDSQKS